jgi:hypothetical protein
MARTKSSCPRQTEEESDIEVPNLPIGPDFENDTTNYGSGDARASNLPIGPDFENDATNQGSGDTGAPNLPIGPHHEDEDGDIENHSSSVYLNLNQDVEEDDRGNVEHEGGENEEDDARNAEHEQDEGNAEQTLVGTLSTSQVRCGHGPNKLTSRCFVITAVNEVGDPTQPLISVNT